MPTPDQARSLQEANELLESIKKVRDLLVDMARSSGIDELLQLVVDRVSVVDDVAVVRIWRTGPGDRCTGCELREGCPNTKECLHTVASRGNSLQDPDEDFSDLDGPFTRIPLSPVRRIAKIFLSGDPYEVRDFQTDRGWVEDRDWQRLPGREAFEMLLEREAVRGFLGTPLVHRDKVLGVIGVYTRSPVTDEGLIWLRIVSDALGAAIVTAQTIEDNVQLTQRLQEENELLRQEVRDVQAFSGIIGSSESIKNVLRQIELVAPTDANVLITGESGTGKELVAREIHARSQRSDRAMVRVNCASIPRELYESEFFGHVKGAFTGAVKDRPGRFELAEGGTLFLDEIGEIPIELQSKLLRALQEGQYERVGEDRTRQVDVRIVAATNRDLMKEIAAERFRQDLYYRLAVFPVEVSPLRDRVSDIPMIAEHFIERACRQWNIPSRRLTLANAHQLQSYDWPGNVRELQNVVERALIVSGEQKLRFDLPRNGELDSALAAPHTSEPETEKDAVLTDLEMRRREKENLRRALERTKWKVYGPAGSAELLGVKPTTLASRMKKFGLRAPR